MSLEAAESGSNSGLALLELGRYDEALERFEQVLLYTRSVRHVCIACGASDELLILHASRKLAAFLPPSLPPLLPLYLSLSPSPPVPLYLSLHPSLPLLISFSLLPSLCLCSARHIHFPLSHESVFF